VSGVPSAILGMASQSLLGTPVAGATTGSGSGKKLTPVEEAKLRKAGAEFESIMLSTFWKSMKQSFSDEDDDESGDPAHDTLEDMGIQAMSTAVGKAGGLGLGKLILKHLAPGLETLPRGQVEHGGKPLNQSADNKA